MAELRRRIILHLALIALAAVVAPASAAAAQKEELLAVSGEVGRLGGRLVLAQRSEPKTFNPVLAADNASREIIHRMMADLIHINRETHKTEPALAKEWKVSRDGRRYTLRLRRGIRFSDGKPLDADDVVFTFRVLLDEKLHSPQRDLLIIGGKPITVRKVDSHTVVFELAEPYGAGERIFDSIAILPRHMLEAPYREGRFANVWGLNVSPREIVGLGPFRLKEYVPGQRVVLEKNPYYWKKDQKGQRLPYLVEIVFLQVPSEDAQVIRFQAGETHLVSRISAENYGALERGQAQGRYQLHDLGASLEYNFLFFNLNDLSKKNLPDVAARQAWFRDVRFRRAVSAAIDREGIVRLVYKGRATPLWAHVTPGNKLWVNTSISREAYSPDRARQLLREAGFQWGADGALRDSAGKPVEFSVLTSAGNTQRLQIATIIQEDLRKLGIKVQVVTLEFRALIDRVFQTHNYEACVLGLGSGDVDPTSEMNVWLSTGGTHLWNLGQPKPSTPWEAEMDRLMQQQMTSTSQAERKRLYDRVQQIVAEQLPILCIVSPNILVGASANVGNLRPAILDHYTLWNAEQLFLKKDVSSGNQ